MREELINGGFIGNNLETRNRQSLKFGFNEFIAAPFGSLREKYVAADEGLRVEWWCCGWLKKLTQVLIMMTL